MLRYAIVYGPNRLAPLVGHLEVIANTRISCECLAATECIVLKIERAGFVKAVKQDPYLWLRMAHPAIARFGDIVFQVDL